MATPRTYYLIDPETDQIWKISALGAKNALAKYIQVKRPNIQGTELIDAVNKLYEDVTIIDSSDARELP